MSEAHGAELLLVHIIEPPGQSYRGYIPMGLAELQAQVDKAAREELARYGDEYGVAQSSRITAIGRPNSEIHRLAKEHKADLIIVGTRGRKGLQLLLGSTANGVVNGAECDVLAVRVR